MMQANLSIVYCTETSSDGESRVGQPFDVSIETRIRKDEYHPRGHERERTTHDPSKDPDHNEEDEEPGDDNEIDDGDEGGPGPIVEEKRQKSLIQPQRESSMVMTQAN